MKDTQGVGLINDFLKIDLQHFACTYFKLQPAPYPEPLICGNTSELVVC